MSPISFQENTGHGAVKEKASELLCVHQSIMQPDRLKHMLGVSFQSYINSHHVLRPEFSTLTSLTLRRAKLLTDLTCLFD